MGRDGPLLPVLEFGHIPEGLAGDFAKIHVNFWASLADRWRRPSFTVGFLWCGILDGSSGGRLNHRLVGRGPFSGGEFDRLLNPLSAQERYQVQTRRSFGSLSPLGQRRIH